jgi:proteasome accessory factor A
MAEVAEYLKVGSTLLVLDMLDAGELNDAPVLTDPLAALRTINGDPSLRATVRVAGGEALTALEIQRWYVNKARDHLARRTVVSLEIRNVFRLWDQALTALETDPGTLVGKLDWVTKRLLLERCADDDVDVKKKVDLRYHEITDGYFRQLERTGVTTTVADEDAVRAAMTIPPQGSPAAQRGKLIRQLASSETTMSVDWDQVRVGGVLRGKVIRLDDFRRK